ncbi:MAG: translation initiation factor IF-2 [Candidatus Ancaeobacter aquaticus]|nr:translation initiation factor IF-2 [Candidatus Ancaeobacter aquaticus]
MRVHELAKELGLVSKDLITKLKELGCDVKGHMSSIDDDTVNKVKGAAGAQDVTVRSKPAKEIPAKTEKEVKKRGRKKKEQDPSKDDAVKEIKKTSEEVPSETIEETIPHVEEPKEEIVDQEVSPEDISEDIIELLMPISVKDFADELALKPNELIMKLMKKGVFASINQTLDFDTCSALASEFGFKIVEKEPEQIIEEIIQHEVLCVDEVDDEKDLRPRWPVVTFMGHVDHGKTSLLDYIRNAKVAAGEKGGITQHIGAYEVVTNRGHITFLDTPGHKAFTEMRARGANVTDITVLVVAADDGPMPQTYEAIDHSLAAEVPILVAINKIDIPDSNPDTVKRKLSEKELTPEDWGGKTIYAPVSAKTGEGIDDLLEMILLQAEIMELKANPNRRAYGVVVEAKTSKKKGHVATVLILKGTLKVGDPIFCDKYSGKVRALFNDRGQSIRKAGPATPVEILGISGAPEAGSEFFVTKTEKEAREISEISSHRSKMASWTAYKHLTLEDLYREIVEGKTKELKLIIKSDVQGSLEALRKSLEELGTKAVTVKVIHEGTGDVSENDIMLAAASNAIVIGFHVKTDSKMRDLARKELVEMRLYSIIYNVVDDVRNAMEGLLEPTYTETIMGHAEVRKVFSVSNAGKVAGCFVKDGKILRNAKVRVLRGDEIVHDGELSSLKRFKDEVKEVGRDFECGIRLVSFDSWQELDMIEAYTLESSATKL